MSKAKIYCAIDFGTSNIKTAIWNSANDEAQMAKLIRGQRVADTNVKNIVIYNDETDFLWHTEAIGKLPHRNAVIHLKRDIEIYDWKKTIVFKKDGIDHSIEKKAVDVLYDLFHRIKNLIEEQKGNEESVEEIILTTPVHYTKQQELILEKAAKRAGLKVGSMLYEPVAAAIAYSMEDYIDWNALTDNSHFLVFDFGGGTLDLTIFSIGEHDRKKRLHIKSSNNIRFGGDNIDRLIYEKLVIPKWQELDYNSLTEEEQQSVWQRLAQPIVELKENLFSDSSIEEELISENSVIQGKNLEIEIRTEEIIEILRSEHITEQIAEIITFMLAELELERKNIEKVVLVGGSSQITFFQSFLKQYFQNEDVLAEIDDDEFIYNAVVKGACHYLIENLNGTNKLEFINTVAYTLGMKMKNRFLPLINRHDQYEFFSPIKYLCDKSGVLEKMPIYQADNYFHQDKEVHIGDLLIDTAKYRGEKLYLRMGVNRHGRIVARIYDDLDDRENYDEIEPTIKEY
jgi:molecular chaperone DnaK (HSP70)